MPVPMHPVVSSSIYYMGYDEDNQELYVTFIKGTTYKYKNVPQQVYNEFRNSSSIGKYYSTYITGHYTSEKIN